MVKWLGFEPAEITYSSDWFDKLYELAEELIRKDKAYVCHCSREEINRQRGGPDNRGPRYACEHRSRPVEESLKEFRGMRDGKYKPGECFLRMKQSIDDPNEGNPQMWDLPAYRVLEQNHHYRTKDKWKIYPTYDFTHCIVDALEGTTHSLCTLEFILSRTYVSLAAQASSEGSSKSFFKLKRRSSSVLIGNIWRHSSRVCAFTPSFHPFILHSDFSFLHSKSF